MPVNCFNKQFHTRRKVQKRPKLIPYHEKQLTGDEDDRSFQLWC